jgi:ornithine cyclodeaminase/alanine dehydrogenase-like protein (mu-crystallin family)
MYRTAQNPPNPYRFIVGAVLKVLRKWRMSSEKGITVHCCDAEKACREADIIVTATPSRDPLFLASGFVRVRT